MASQGSTHSDRAEWNEAEIHGMLDYLDQHKSVIGETGNFKASAYTSVAKNIVQHLTAGPAKTRKMVKSKWQSVCSLHESLIHYLYVISIAQIGLQCNPELLTNVRLSLGQQEGSGDRWGGGHKCLEHIYGEKGLLLLSLYIVHCFNSPITPTGRLTTL